MANCPQIQVRQITEADIAAFYSLRLEALENEPLAFSSSAEDHLSLSQAELLKRLGCGQGEHSYVLAAFQGEQVVGMAGFFQGKGRKTLHRGHIWGVYVTPDLRGRGIARKILQEIIRRAEALPELTQITLAVSTTQSAAKQLYESLHFEVYAIDIGAIKAGAVYVDQELMMLRLHHSEFS